MRTYHAIYAWLAALLFITIFVVLGLLALEFGIKPNIRREHGNLIQLCLQATDYAHAKRAVL